MNASNMPLAFGGLVGFGTLDGATVGDEALKSFSVGAFVGLIGFDGLFVRFLEVKSVIVG